MYVNFMDEYLALDHMEQDQGTDKAIPEFFLPHHEVIKEQSTTTKLRVVFNGSAPSDSGSSLNCLQSNGPNIQSDIVSILLRFRQHQYVISADVENIYLQVLVNPNQTNLQKILWRRDPSEAILEYKLKTVTYGTTSAAFLAIRYINQLANEYSDTYPEASNTILTDFYVDDLLTECDSIDTLIQLSIKISEILDTGCFKLRKWNLNNSRVLEGIKMIHSDQALYFGNAECSKTLGLYWENSKDILRYKISPPNQQRRVTKRVILSEAQIFDPLGILAPCVIIPKLMLQELWSLKLSWDERLPQDLQMKWLNFRNNLVELNQLSIPRHVGHESSVSFQIHGFSDASERAYGACIYLRVTLANGSNIVNLLSAKGRMAQLKTITIPRLELCGSLVLSQLCEQVKGSLKHQISSVFFGPSQL